MTRYILIPALAAVIGLGGWAAYQKVVIDKLRVENASYQRSIDALEKTIEQSALAREVERARASLWQARAEKLNASIEALFTGDIDDQVLDPRIADYINSLRED